METTYNVKLWKTSVYKGTRKTTYTVRWELDGKEWRQPFATVALADSFRAELVLATSRGKAFSTTTGRPLSKESKASETNWYTFAVGFADAQWERTSANNRKVVSKVLMAATVALLRAPVPGHILPVDLRTALREYGFNARRREEAPPETAAILKWVERNTLSMAAWEDAGKVDGVLRCLSRKLDGTPVAASSVKRSRRVMNVAMEQAVKDGVLGQNPLPKGKGSAPKTSLAVDKRALMSPDQAARLLGAIKGRTRGGARLYPFFATMYYVGTRPEEAVALRVSDVRLPAPEAADQWGELLVHTAQPEVGKHWTDSGAIHEERGLKGRASDDMRTVPCRPALTRILRDHIAAEGLKAGDLVFQGEKGDMLAGSVIRRAWTTSRKGVLSPEDYASPLAKKVYDLRHTCLTNWLNDGVPPAQVAEWAGNSVPVLLAVYARCITGHLADLKKRIEAGGDLPEVGPAG
ncbi:tyrosine-type recombinase/integrase [Streptomyces sp. NPDC051555]|uniref:tyrosine-type recombinase/integrase n=1 Tax=Streptomyces sp. NPDC051555 TaxID=3365657 RepID=UPI0037B3F65E